jgi:uncharacterized protein YbjT (DUF2867 family)
MDDRSSLDRAMAGVYGVYSVQDFWTVGAEREIQQGKNVADAVQATTVEHLVYSSVGGAERNAGIDHWDSRWIVEQHIRRLGIPTTMIRPASFMENLNRLLMCSHVCSADRRSRIGFARRGGKTNARSPSSATRSADRYRRPEETRCRKTAHHRDNDRRISPATSRR